MKDQIVILENYEKLLFDKLLSEVAYGSDQEIAAAARKLYAEIFGLEGANLYP